MIIIIGAGPAGSFLAGLLAKQGHRVRIFEEHETVGMPIQCTGILTFVMEEFIKPKKEFVVNRIKNIEVVAPDNSSVKIELKKEETIVNRTKFDQYLCNKAVDNGAELFTSHRFLDYKDGRVIVKDTKNIKTKTLETDILVGADGPNSQVAKAAGLFGKRRYFIGAQATVRIKTDLHTYKTYFGSVCPDFFAWMVPESENIARVGLASMKNPTFYFKKFLKRINCKKVLEYQGGLIPLYNPKIRTQKNNIYLVGDAATQVKATTAGGIIQGLAAARILAESIKKKKDYDREWRKKIGRELWIHLKLRNILDKFSDEDYNYLIKLMKQKRVLNVLKSESRDRPLRLLLKSLLAEPRFLRYLPKLV